MRVILLTALAFVGSLATGLLKPALSFFMREGLGSSFLGVSTLTAGYMLGRSFTSYVVGRIPKRIGGFVPPASLVACGLMVGLYPLAKFWWEVSLISTLHGALMGLTWPLIQYEVMASGGERWGRAISAYFFLGSLAGPVSDALYGLVFSRSSLEAVIVASAYLYLLSSLLALGPPELPESKARSKTGVTSLLVLGFGVGGAASMMGSSLTYVLLREWFKMGKGDVALTLSLLGLLSLGSKLLSGLLIEKLGAGRALRSLTTSLLLGTALISTGEIHAFILGLALLYTSVGGLIPTSRAYAYTLRDATGSIGKVNSAGNVGTFVGLILAGLAVDVSPDPAITLSTILVTFSGLAFISSLKFD